MLLCLSLLALSLQLCLVFFLDCFDDWLLLLLESLWVYVLMLLDLMLYWL